MFNSKLMTSISIGIIIVYCVWQYVYHQTQTDVNITVTGTERVISSDGESVDSKYLIFTTLETFENSDNLILGKWNSSDVQGSVRPDSTYLAHVVGWRVPFLSMYRNILTIK